MTDQAKDLRERMKRERERQRKAKRNLRAGLAKRTTNASDAPLTWKDLHERIGQAIANNPALASERAFVQVDTGCIVSVCLNFTEYVDCIEDTCIEAIDLQDYDV